MNVDLNLVGIISLGIGVGLYAIHPHASKHASAKTLGKESVSEYLFDLIRTDKEKTPH
jgi:hypothetical protein